MRCFAATNFYFSHFKRLEGCERFEVEGAGAGEAERRNLAET
jgi:hypothetical protein